MNSINDMLREGLLDDPEEVMAQMENPKVLAVAEMNSIFKAYEKIPKGPGLDCMGQKIQPNDWVFYVPQKGIKGLVELQLGKVVSVAKYATIQLPMGRVTRPTGCCIKIDVKDIIK